MEINLLLSAKQLLDLRRQFAIAKDMGCRYLILSMGNGTICHSWVYIKDDEGLRKKLAQADVEDAKPNDDCFKERLVAIFDTSQECPPF